MTEILTESFCERCGTRYTFESKAARAGKGRGIRTLTSGLKNFVLSDDSSFGDAMAAARSEEEREVTNQQLDAFHETFNFCMSCRQYTCGNCWNEGEGRCLTCSPLPDEEAITNLFPALEATPPIAAEHRHISADAWPALDLTVAPPEPVAAEEPPVPVQDAAPPALEPAATTDVAAEPTVVAQPPVEIDLAGVAATAEVATAAASQTRSLLGRFRPGQNIDDELAAFERAVAAAEAADKSKPRPVRGDAAAEPEPEAVAEPGVVPEPVAEVEAVAEAAAEPEVAPEPVAAEPEPVAASTVAASDLIEQPVWRIVAPDETGAAPMPTNGVPPIPPAGSEPQWPTAPSDRLDFLRTGRSADDVWAASSKDLFAAPRAPVAGSAPVVIQACSSCGLSLSATARFCRRCGTRQG